MAWNLAVEKFPRTSDYSQLFSNLEDVIAKYGANPNVKREYAHSTASEVTVELDGSRATINIAKEEEAIYCLSLPLPGTYLSHFSIIFHSLGCNLDKVGILSTPHPVFSTGTKLMRLILAILDALGTPSVFLTDCSEVRLSGSKSFVSLPLVRLFQGKSMSWYGNFGFCLIGDPTAVLEKELLSYPLTQISEIVHVELARHHSTFGSYMTSLLLQDPVLFTHQISFDTLLSFPQSLRKTIQALVNRQYIKFF